MDLRNLDYLPEGWTLQQAMEHVDYLTAMFSRIQIGHLTHPASVALFDQIWMFKECIANRWGEGMDKPCQFVHWTGAML